MSGFCQFLRISLPDSYPSMQVQPSSTRNTLDKVQSQIKACEVFHELSVSTEPHTAHAHSEMNEGSGRMETALSCFQPCRLAHSTDGNARK